MYRSPFLKKLLSLNINSILFLVPLRPERRFLFMRYHLPGDPVFSVPARIVQDRHRLHNGMIELESTISGFSRRTFVAEELAAKIERDRLLSPSSRRYDMFARLEI